ncbi:hypothetical protein GCM10027275_07250 [Rhabdobacter roseus]|uniref:Sensor histidine kinase YesM n=1 Tax=Rhabdobacter roseus TaxID=1655419 RepID=A0A840TM38_9BACT|nr:histidine kinase [Rhabdobacter roseus]MBB5282622.1 sensor histidine kinase YesM [Rhabdobacter roseus]
MKRFQWKLGLNMSLLLTCIVLPGRLVRLYLGDENVPNLVASETVIFLMCVVSWISLQWCMRTPRLSARWLRVLLAVLGCIFFTTIFNLLSPFEDFPNTPLIPMPLPNRLIILAMRGVMVGVLMLVAYLYVEQQEKIQFTRMQLEQLKQENLAVQLSSLRQQINPHFLFNSLNVLKSGAREEWVKDYVMQLAHVYRYLLRHNHEANLVTVAEEMDFIRAYLYILNERFEDGLQVVIRLTPAAETRRLPVLALQLVLENAVKHNVVALARPLFIDIYQENGSLVVKNNVQPKKGGYQGMEIGSGIGLKNLTERYRLLAQKSPSITHTPQYFIVQLPLLD